LNEVFTQYEELSSPKFAVINLSLRLRLIRANFGLDNSSYRAQPHSIIVNYYYTYIFGKVAESNCIKCTVLLIFSHNIYSSATFSAIKCDLIQVIYSCFEIENTVIVLPCDHAMDRLACNQD
jgi:hypothetical protein